ncbi:hypothetical protein D3C78_1447920 [compost metagenome]
MLVRKIRRLADEHPGLGVFEKVRQLVVLIGGIERQVDGAHAQRGEVEAIVPGRFVDLHGHPVAWLHAQTDQGMGVARGRAQHLGVADDPAVVGFEEGCAIGLAGDGFKGGEDVGVHGVGGVCGVGGKGVGQAGAPTVSATPSAM